MGYKFVLILGGMHLSHNTDSRRLDIEDSWETLTRLQPEIFEVEDRFHTYRKEDPAVIDVGTEHCAVCSLCPWHCIDSHLSHRDGL